MSKFILIVLVCLSLNPGIVFAQTYKIGVSRFAAHPSLNAIVKGLEDYFSDRHISVQFTMHNANADRQTAAQIAEQMLKEKNDLLIAVATPAAQACARILEKAPASIKRPLVFSAVTDPVQAGLVAGLQKPGGDITGLCDQVPLEEQVKMMTALKPALKRVGVLYSAKEPSSISTMRRLKALETTMGLAFIGSTVRSGADTSQAAVKLAGQVDAIFIPQDNTVVSSLASVVASGEAHKLPIFACDVETVAQGVVAALGIDYYQHGYRTGAIAFRILQGENPSDIPVECPKEVKLHINKGAARKMGIIPCPNMLKKAQKVYE